MKQTHTQSFGSSIDRLSSVMPAPQRSQSRPAPSLCLFFSLAILFFLSRSAFLSLSSLSWVIKQFEGWMGIWDCWPIHTKLMNIKKYRWSSLWRFFRCEGPISCGRRLEPCLLCLCWFRAWFWRCRPCEQGLSARRTWSSNPYSSDYSWSFFWCLREQRSVPFLTFCAG